MGLGLFKCGAIMRFKLAFLIEGVYYQERASKDRKVWWGDKLN